MSDNNYYTGEITITPPLTRSQIAKVQEGFVNITDVKLRVINTEEESNDGNSVTITSIADAIIPLTGTYTGRNIVADIQALVDYFGDREYDGYIQVQWDSGYGDPLPTRYQVAEGRVVEIRPELTWPSEVAA